MHKVAETSSCTLPHLVLTAAGLSEVSHRGELGMDGLPVEPAIVQVNHSLLCILFTAELYVYISN